MRHSREPRISCVPFQLYSLKEDIPLRNENSCRFHEPYLFGVPSRGRPGEPYYPIIKVYLHSFNSHCSWRHLAGTGVQGVPAGFTHSGPIRSRHLGSRDPRTSFDPSDTIASKMVGITTRFEVLPPLEEWHLNLEVGSQVYELLEVLKQLRKAILWPDTTSLSHRGGFQNGVRESTPSGCYSSTSGQRVLSSPVRNLHLGEYERNNLSPGILSFS